MNPYFYIVAVMCIAACILFACGKTSSPPANESSDGEHNRLYKEACELIKPYMILQGAQAKDAAASRGRRDITRGIENLKAVVQINPENWAAFWVMGKAYQAQGMPNEACDAFSKAYFLQKQNEDVAREYMFECLKVERTKEGLVLAYAALKLHSDDAGLKANLALCLLLDAQLDKALEIANDALKANPSDEISKRVKRIIDEVQIGKRPQPRKYGDLKNAAQ